MKVIIRKSLSLIVTPLGRGHFRAEIDGRQIVASSRTPFLDAARVLLAEGIDAGGMSS